MKTIKRILPLLLIVILVLGLFPMGTFAAEDGTIPTEDPSGEITEAAPSPEAEATTPPEAPPADTGSEVPDRPAETPETPEATTEPEATPPEETAPPAAEETTSPQPEETEQPEPEASPSPMPEVEVPNDDEPSIEKPCGDGIEMGPNNPPEDAPMMFAAYSNSATIAVRSCYDSANNSIKYANSFQYDGRWVGGATYPRHIIYDGHVSGIQFRITGGGIDQLVTTDSGGRVKVEGLKPGSYTVYEQVPEGYFSDRVSQSVTVRDRETATVTFNNTLKKWRVSVAKVDADGITRNSDATLEGAVYGVFKGGQLQDRYTTDSQGQFTTKYYPCDDDWTLRELESPTGYTVDPTEYPIGAEPGDFTQATKDMTLTVKERIIKGNLLIIKQDAETQTPLAGAKFRVLDSTGAMVAEGETGPDGRLAVDDLVYGDYQWQEVSPPKYFELDETLHDFSIEEDGVTVTVTCDDHRIPGSITVYKNDTKGNSLAGATYLLEWSADGSSWQPVSYRDDGEVLTGGCTSPGLANGQLTTGSDGTVTFSGLRADGEIKYRLTESKAPAGMSLLKDPIYTGTLPVEGDSDPIYDISATVTDTRITDLPMTGSSGLWPVTLGTALAGLAAVAGFFYTHKKSKRRSAA